MSIHHFRKQFPITFDDIQLIAADQPTVKVTPAKQHPLMYYRAKSRLAFTALHSMAHSRQCHG